MSTELEQHPRSVSLRGNFPALTGLRAIASIAIVATHAAFWTGRYGTSTVGLFWSRLDFGVALFFALSGFLLFRPWVQSLTNDADLPKTGRYFWNRTLRILPAYWITVALAFVVLESPTGMGANGLIRHLTFTQIYGADHLHSGLTQTWSLAVEVVFYALLPLLGWFVVRVVCRGQWRPERILVFLGLLCVVSCAYLVVIHSFQDLSLSTRMWLPARFTWFAVGMALTVVVTAARERRDWAVRAQAYVEDSPFAIFLLGLGLFALSCTPAAGGGTLAPDSAGTAITRYLLYAGAAFLMMVPLLTEKPNPIQNAIARPTMQWLGLISYELFLIHVMLLELAMNILDYPVFTGTFTYVFALTMALSVPASWLLYRALDRPLRRLHR